MPPFSYKARDQQGKLVKGTLEAPSQDVAMRQVDRMGLIPIDVQALASASRSPAQPPAAKAGKISTGKKIPLADLVVMSRQLCTLLQAGVPILSCMEALVAQTTNASLRAVLVSVQRDVEAGTKLSAAFAKYPKTFSSLYVQTVRAGETGGVLPEVLLRLADLMERDLETTRAVKAAIRYPVMVVIALIIAFIILITFVVPRFAALFARFDTPLPLPTRILIGTNHLIVGWWYIVLPALAVGFISLYGYIQTPPGRYRWDKMLLKLPVFGDLILKFSMARFSQMFSTLYKSGVPVLRVIEIVSQSVGNAVVGKDVAGMAASVQQGRGLAEAIRGSRYFPPMVVHMLSVGEKSGSVDTMLDEVAKHYDMETQYTVRNLTSLIEPMLIVGLGLIVLLLALGIFLPMWNMIQLYRR